MSVLIGEPTKFGGFARTPEPGGAGFLGRAREAASFARRENPIQFGSNLIDNEIFDEEIAAIARDTGIRIPHPVKGRFEDAEEEIRRRQEVLLNQGFRGASVQIAREEVQRRRYDEEVAKAKARFPDAAAFAPENSFNERRKRRAATFEAKAAEGGFLANLAGGIIAAPTDPLTVATAPLGFTSKTVLGAFLKNAALNVGLQTAVEPALQARRTELGLEASFEAGVIDITAAGIFGGGLGAGGKLIEKALPRARQAEIGRTLDDPELRAGAHEIDREIEIEADIASAAGGPLEAPGRAAAARRLDAAERVIDAVEAAETPSRRDIEALRGDGPKIEARPIRQDVAVTPRGREVAVTYAIVELDTLVASHDVNLARNPRFPAELQPRDRGRAASAAQIADIAANLNPKLLDNSSAAGDGAPVVRGDGVVLSGNGRVLGIERAYERGFAAADAYRAYLEGQGYPVGDTARPVLVRIAEPLDDLEGFAREANERATAALSAPEQARADAENLTPGDFVLLDGNDPLAVKNARFIRAVVDRIAPEAERASLMDRAGALSPEGRRRVRNAIAAYAYDDAALIDRLLEAEDELKGLGQALMDAAPDFARLKSDVAAGLVDRRVDLRRHVGEAAAIVAEARRSGRNVAEFVGQEDMFSGVVDARTVAFLRLFFRNDDFTGPRARAKIAEELAFYAAEARKVDAAPALFAETGDPGGRILDAVARRADGGEPGAPGLFDPGEDAEAPSLLREPATGDRAPQPAEPRAGGVEAPPPRPPEIEARLAAFVSDAKRFDDPIAVVNSADEAATIAELGRLRQETIDLENVLAKKYGVSRRNLFEVEDRATAIENEFLFQSALDIEKIDKLLSLLESPHDAIDLRFDGQAALRDLPDSEGLRNPSETEKFAIARLIAFNKAANQRGEDFLSQIKQTIKARAARLATSGDQIDADDFEFIAKADLERVKALFETPSSEPAAGNRLPQPAEPRAGGVEAPPPRPPEIEAFDDPLSPAAKAARAAEIADALAEIDADPQARLVTGDLDAAADKSLTARTQSRAELEAEFAADEAIIERLKGCVG